MSNPWALVSSHALSPDAPPPQFEPSSSSARRPGNRAPAPGFQDPWQESSPEKSDFGGNLLNDDAEDFAKDGGEVAANPHDHPYTTAQNNDYQWTTGSTLGRGASAPRFPEQDPAYVSRGKGGGDDDEPSNENDLLLPNGISLHDLFPDTDTAAEKLEDAAHVLDGLKPHELSYDAVVAVNTHSWSFSPIRFIHHRN